MKYQTYFIIFILLSSVIYSSGSSAGDDDAPPPSSSGGGGGGGSPLFYDYYIPLVFDENHILGKSEVSIWVIQPAIIITDFSLSEAGNNVVQINTPTKLTFNPTDNPGLENGSLIRSSSPLLVVGHRSTEDIFSDNSFGYSVLIDRMMGFQFISPVNGWFNGITLTQNTQITYINENNNLQIRNIPAGGTNDAIPVRKGDVINSSAPINGAFISYENGTYASMAVPKYLQGSDYIFDTNLIAPRQDEISLSYLSIIPDKPTEIQILYENGGIESIEIFEQINLALSKSMRAIHSTRGSISVSIQQKLAYGGQIRQSLVQLISSTQMRAGELFVTPIGYSTHISALKENTTYVTGIYDEDSANYLASTKSGILRTLYEVVRYQGLTDSNLISGDHESFGFSTSPGLASHPMAPSVSFLNLPLNPNTNRPNVTGLESTWFRFPNLAVGSIKILPGPPEEYTGQVIEVTILSNGSLPASRFNLEITIDQEIVIAREFDFLQVNETLVFSFNEFLNFGKKSINITARVDITDNVNEINEDDNSDTLDVEVQQNIRLRFSIYAVLVFLSLFIIYRIRIRLRRNQAITRSHVDTIVNFDSEGEEL
ncbi:MAG: hypothetical protein GPJ54_22185 [Candidatus Heimdallarchaeota archaeon]|nr:hypothetical protein [Candidatus Heimdallarchaeota archaeon]